MLPKKSANEFLREQAKRGISANDKSLMDVYLLLTDIEHDGLEKARESRGPDEWARIVQLAQRYGFTFE